MIIAIGAHECLAYNVVHAVKVYGSFLAVYVEGMPEGPELARSRDRLKQLLVGKYVHSIAGLDGGRYGLNGEDIVGLDEWCAEVTDNGDHWNDGQLVKDIGVKGKFMWWHLGEWFLWCTYGMSGQWMSTFDPKHTAVQVCYNDSPERIHPCSQAVQTLNFVDSRHFGTVKLVRGREALDKKLRSLGPDMLNDPPDVDGFRARLLKRYEKTLAEALMDQSCISGVGNYIKAEALYLAELSPHRLVRDLKNHEVDRLRQQIINVMKASYNNDGATIRSYLNVDGTKGGMKTRFLVYGNQTDPLGNPVVKEETKDGRTTHWVPSVQR